MLVLVVQDVDQVDEALLGGDGTIGEVGQFIDEPVIETSAQLQVIHHRSGVVAQIAEGEPDGSPFAVSGLKAPCSDGQLNGRRVAFGQVQRLTLRQRGRPDVLSLGKQLLGMGSDLTAVVVGAADLHDLHACVDQVDHRFEARVVQRVGQQSFRWVIGSDQQQNAVGGTMP